jgi:ribonucleoside-diphosphate reductase alpha chain
MKRVKEMKKPEVQSEQITVVKRDGRLVPFQKDRITYAIEAAFRDVKEVNKDKPLSDELKKTISSITDKIITQLIKLASKGTCLTVEGIQDFVEVTLMKLGHHDVARGYILYREERKAEREMQDIKIYRHDGQTKAKFNPMKIALSIERCFRRCKKIEGQTSEEILNTVETITQKVVQKAVLFSEDNQTLHVSHLQDWIEEALMEDRCFDAARDYILERSKKDQEQQTIYPISDSEDEEKKEEKTISVETEDGNKKVTERQLKNIFSFAARGLESDVNVDDLVATSLLNFYEGMKEKELDQSNIMAARCKIEKDPAYSKVASRLLLDVIYRETLGISASDTKLKKEHGDYFKKYIKHGISINRVSPDLLQFDLDELAKQMDLARDDLFNYLGLQTLYDRYFIHQKEKRLETPQIFWMRVAMGLALKEGEKKNQKAAEFYHLLSNFKFLSSTPTLFNSGTCHSQLSSCYLSTVMDDLHHIFKTISDDAQLSKWAGGLGNDWSNVRATGSVIKGTNGKSQGVIPFLKVANDTALAVNQCFDPSTKIYTNRGIIPISEVRQGDLVLGISGTYREVQDIFIYNQKDGMITIEIKHAIDPICVTDGHPFYAICDVPMEQSIETTLQGLNKGTLEAKWVEASQLQEGDYLAQVIPQEIVQVPGLSEEDARLYGILLGKGHMNQSGLEWEVSGHPEKNEHLTFVRNYLEQRNIHFCETKQESTCSQIRWALGKDVVRDATTGSFVENCESTLPFAYDDLYNKDGCKQIAPRLSHLPRPQTKALIHGLLETNGKISRGKEIAFSSTSETLTEGLRYQLLRLGIPTSGAFKNDNDAEGYDLHILADKEIAELVGVKPSTKRNWFQYQDKIFTRVTKTEQAPTTPFVCDLLVEGAASYMTTSALAHNGGKRKGAMCAYLEVWHLDIEDFLELRKNTGDERRRTHDMNTANWIPDLFMKRVKANQTWTLFSPSDVPDLHDLYGKEFEERYEEYEKMAKDGKLPLSKTVDAMQLWRKMLSMLFETGHPWITFKDPSNIRSPQSHAGVVHSSNLCTEILLNTSKDETAVCNLGSINLAQHIKDGALDEKKLASTVRTAVRMLDNVIDINFYPIAEAQNSNLKHRPIGLGIMGFQDALYLLGISYASPEAVIFADESMEMISYYAILASSELAKEKGTYATYKNSKWDQGLLPIDTLDLLESERGQPIDVDRSSRMNWDPVREHIKNHGMRNSNTMAIAPTATIGNIAGVIPSIEPMYKHLFVKSNLSGEFTVTNRYLVEKLKTLGLWDDEMIDDLKYFDGVISEIERIPDEVKELFPTAFDTDAEWLIKCGSRRQKWIDMGQSLNLYINEPSGKKLHQMYFSCWEKGLKTTYYLRSLAATQIEKSSIDVNRRGLQPRWMKNKSASSSISVQRGAVCNLEEGCESCQ